MCSITFRVLGESINLMSRPVDAIKHQAKTVTVGTSRISERVEGILFDTLFDHELDIAQVVNRNVIVMKNIQAVIDHVKGSILYRIDGLNLLGDPRIRPPSPSSKRREFWPNCPPGWKPTPAQGHQAHHRSPGQRLYRQGTQGRPQHRGDPGHIRRPHGRQPHPLSAAAEHRL
jgi:hypothetical protein